MRGTKVSPDVTGDAIRSRRNVRQYTDQPLTAHELDQILEAGRRSPSSRNWHPWDFVVVTDHAQLAPAVSGSSGTRPASPRGSASGEYRRPRHRCMEGVQMEQIQITATLPNIAPGNLSEFKEVARRALELTKGETTTLQYD